MTAATEKPKYVQLADDLRERIRSGELKVGDRLPSYAEMYRRYGATTATVQRVCGLLEQEQLIERRFGSGVYVAQPQKNRTGNIGFIGGASFKTPSIPFYQHLMGAVQDATRTNGQHLLHLGSKIDWDPRACDKVDGVLLCDIANPTPVLQKLPPHLPRVSILTIVDGVTSVGVDDYSAAQMATRHLLSLGHRRIACLMEKSFAKGRSRFAGYRDALLEAGVEIAPNWIRLTDAVPLGKVDLATAQPYREWGRRQMSTWLSEDWNETNCTAIVVQNEVAAIGAMQILQKEGIEVPQQVSVVTFDGTELCDLVMPRLCAVALPLAQIGAKAIEVLNRQIAGGASSVLAVLLPVSLREGESVAAAP